MVSVPPRWIGPEVSVEEGNLLRRALGERPSLNDERDSRARDLLNQPTSRRLLRESSAMPGAVEVAGRLERAIVDGRPLAIYGDYDADGITATAVLWRVLKTAYPQADMRRYVPHRIEEGYGLNEGALRKLRSEGVQTVVTVDCGASALGPSRVAREVGLELLITDHHDVEPAGIAEVDAIAHPALPGREHAPFTKVCGAAVAFKVAHAFAMCTGKHAARCMDETLEECIQLVAIGTVADVVPLEDENRVFVARGLELMRSTGVVGLRALLDDALEDKRRRVDAADVGFRLGPRLNAVGRLGHAEDAVELLVTPDKDRAREIVARLSGLNELRRRMDAEAFAQACARVDSDPSLLDAGAIVLADAGWHEGIVGVVAAKVAERYGRPAILLSLREDGTAKGSGRSVDGIDLLATVRASAGSMLLRGGGHAFAMGLTIRAVDVRGFADLVSDACRAATGGLPVGRVLRFDGDASCGDFTPAAVRALDRLRPYGRGNPQPTFRLRDVRPLAPPRRFGKDGSHLEFHLPGGLRAIIWRAADEDVAKVRQGVPIDLLVRPSMASFAGIEHVQLEAASVRAAEPARLR